MSAKRYNSKYSKTVKVTSSENNAMQQLKEKAKEIDRREEYRSKRSYEKKPRAIRRFEKYANMSNDKNEKDT